MTEQGTKTIDSANCSTSNSNDLNSSSPSNSNDLNCCSTPVSNDLNCCSTPVSNDLNCGSTSNSDDLNCCSTSNSNDINNVTLIDFNLPSADPSENDHFYCSPHIDNKFEPKFPDRLHSEVDLARNEKDVSNIIVSSPVAPEELPEKLSVHPNVLAKAIEELIELFSEEVSFEVAVEVGRDLRNGHLELLGVLEEVPEELRIVDEPGLDVFGQPIISKTKINYECECPKCKRTIVAARFAPHLEKCMGMGRNSSRIASRRIASSASNANSANSTADKSSSQGSSSNGASAQTSDLGLGSDEDNIDEDEDDDEEWTMERKKKTKKSSDKSSGKKYLKGPVGRLRNAENASGKKKGGSPSVSVAASPAPVGPMEPPLTIINEIKIEEDFNVVNPIYPPQCN